MSGILPNYSDQVQILPGQAQLTIPEIILFPRLGLGETERLSPQKVSLLLRVVFDQPPGACLSDDINETLCYHTLRDDFRALVASKHYKLIEHLAEALLEATTRLIETRHLAPATVQMHLHKIAVPLADVPHGAVFSLARRIGASANELQ
jgi:dihydroneopterin aldolase